MRGKVVSSFALPAPLGQSFYVVSDGTGQMAVRAKDSPTVNSVVRVTGTLQGVAAVALPFVRQFKVAEVMVEEKTRDVER